MNDSSDEVLGAIETEIALLMRMGEATRRATPVEPHRALDRAAYVILRQLDEAGPTNVSTLAARLNLDGSTITRQVTAMQRDGLVTRAPDPADGRGTLISPTAHGLHCVSVVRAARREIYGKILADWNAADRATLATLMHRLNVSLSAHKPTARN
ncbi:MarR family winged helix-turn-helix transcriptional regulator [Catenuloplanes atrovinosus]|uniref:DNA-binding MarR family transcriptional regulator n=1 Tax=Catenuloplanes atrovinosus TaxID=137266 RepID=A0AAE4CCT5_9ACTN|nr:MarR family transcriptional regulator [Catenuloplanes atrovinosus]MDR7278354.1 DNA-binding MarR family transcriptional regulator [Catenuloplanes atrovinosus]